MGADTTRQSALISAELIPASPAHSPDKNTPMIPTLCGSVLASLTRPPNLQSPTMILILCVVALVISLPIPPPMDSQEKEQPYTFRGLDCFSQRHTEVKSFFAAEPADCQNADIFMEPSLKPAQIISVSNFHPIEAVWCSVKIKAFTASCGESSSINMRNHFMFNKQIFDSEFSPPPQQCYEANKTNTLTWVVPGLGSYTGQSITTPLQHGRAEGSHYAYNQVPGTYGCSGFTWTDPRNLTHLNAALQFDFSIQVQPIWLQYNLEQNIMIAPDLLTFHMSHANEFNRTIPSPLQPAIRHKNIHTKDPERVRMLNIVTRVATPQEKKLLFGTETDNHVNIESIAKDPFRSKIVDQIIASYSKNFSAGHEDFHLRDWAKRSVEHQLTWLHDSDLGVFVLLTQDLPRSRCDSARVIAESHHGHFFQSKNTRFSSIYRFKDPQSDIGLAAFLDKPVDICGTQMWAIHRTEILINMVNSTLQFAKLPPVSEQFLNSDIQADSKLVTLATTSTLNMVTMHQKLDVRACEIHRTTIRNSLSLITNDLQYMVDEEGQPTFSFTQGEVVYSLPCQQQEARVRSTPGICCSELPIWVKDEQTGEFTTEMFLSPFSKRITPFCSPIQCVKHYPSYHNVSTPEREVYYRIVDGIPELTHSAPPPLTPRGVGTAHIIPNDKSSVYTKDQDFNLQKRLHQGQAREAFLTTASLGIVSTINNLLAPIIPAVKAEIPANFMSALETFFSTGPLQGILANLPFYAQIALGFGSIILLVWGMSHFGFLGVTFCTKASDNIRDAFLTTAAPTIGLSKVITFSKDQEKVNVSTKQSIKEVSDSTQKLLIQNNWFKQYVNQTLEQHQSDIQYLKSNCVCKSRHNQCTSSE